MKKKDFEELVTSIRQAGRIRRGEAPPSRVTEFAPVDVKTIRQRLGKSQAEFARSHGDKDPSLLTYLAVAYDELHDSRALPTALEARRRIEAAGDPAPRELLAMIERLEGR